MAYSELWSLFTPEVIFLASDVLKKKIIKPRVESHLAVRPKYGKLRIMVTFYSTKVVNLGCFFCV